MNKKTNWSQFGTLITVFFFWGFVAASNDILIPVFKKAFTLTQLQSQLVAMAFYVAYTVGSIIYIAISKMIGGDLLNKTGYKNGIALGLIISALGTLMFYPAANNASFTLMLTALFIVALGFSLQQIAANPLAIVIGDPQTGSQRLSMAGGVNNFGTTIGPLLVSFAIFGSVGSGNTEASITDVKIPYLFLGVAFILVAVFFKFSSIPNKIEMEPEPATDIEESPTFKADSTVRNSTITRNSALGYPQLVLGMIGIFVYVGVEVATASNLPEYLRQHIELLNGKYVLKSLHLPGAKEFTNDLNAPFISLYWASLMMGRWSNSADAFNISTGAKKALSFIMPYVAFIVFLIVNTIAKHDISTFYIYAVLILAMIAGNVLSKGNPATMLLIFSLLGITALVIGMLTSGLVSVFAFVSVGLFCSTLWPCIFTLAVAGLGKYTNQGSSFLIMMIMGGGFIAALQGWLADKVTGIQYSYIVGAVCFAYLAFFAIRAKSILKLQGIDYDKPVTGGH